MKFFETIDKLKKLLEGIRLIGNIPKALFQGMRLAWGFIGWVLMSILKLLTNQTVIAVAFIWGFLYFISHPKQVLEWIYNHLRFTAAIFIINAFFAAGCLFFSETVEQGLARFENFWLNLATRATELSFNIEEEEENSVVRRSEEEYRNGQQLPTQTVTQTITQPTETDDSKAAAEKAVAEALKSFEERPVLFVETHKIHIAQWVQNYGLADRETVIGEFNDVLKGTLSYPLKNRLVSSVSVNTETGRIDIKFDTSVSKKVLSPAIEGGMNLTIIGPFLNYEAYNSNLLYGTTYAIFGLYGKSFDFSTSYTSLLSAAEEKAKREILPKDLCAFLSDLKSKIDFKLEQKYTISFNGVSSKDDYTIEDLKTIFGIDIPEGDLKITIPFSTEISTSTFIFQEDDVVDNFNSPFALYKECEENEDYSSYFKIGAHDNHKIVVSPRVATDNFIMKVITAVLPASTDNKTGF